MSAAANDLRYLSETQVRGRVLRWEGSPRGQRSIVRWRIVGYCQRRPSSAVFARDTTGQVGNRFVILERLDGNSTREPAGTRKVVAKQSFPPQGYTLEPEVTS